jgi:hypothetical protein
VSERAFPFAPPPLSLVIDPARHLPVGIEGELHGAYEKVRKRFPQVDFSFCFVHLQDGMALQEFAFWLHNSAPGADEARAWLILVVGDLASGRLTLTAGYGLEPFIKAPAWEAALQELAACQADGQWEQGLSGFLLDARDLLTVAWNTAEQRRKGSHRKPENKERRSDSPQNEAEEAAAVAGPETTSNPAGPYGAEPAGPASAGGLPPVPRYEPQVIEDAMTSR